MLAAPGRRPPVFLCRKYDYKHYLRKAKNTASTRQAKEARWFQWKAWPLKTNITITVKMLREMTSWITLSCIRLKGPPLSSKPMRLAGTVRQYSKNAIPQEKRIISISGQPVEIFISLSLRCPYQAKVINTLEKTRRSTVQSPCIC